MIKSKWPMLLDTIHMILMLNRPYVKYIFGHRPSTTLYAKSMLMNNQLARKREGIILQNTLIKPLSHTYNIHGAFEHGHGNLVQRKANS